MTSRSGGFSKARLGRMRDVMAAQVERGGIPGLVTLVSRRATWDGGLGTSWATDPTEELVGILMTLGMWTSPRGSDVYHGFRTQAYQAIDD